jgi:hypothetical protein
VKSIDEAWELIRWELRQYAYSCAFDLYPDRVLCVMDELFKLAERAVREQGEQILAEPYKPLAARKVGEEAIDAELHVRATLAKLERQAGKWAPDEKTAADWVGKVGLHLREKAPDLMRLPYPKGAFNRAGEWKLRDCIRQTRRVTEPEVWGEIDEETGEFGPGKEKE